MSKGKLLFGLAFLGGLVAVLIGGNPQWHWIIYGVQGHLLGDGPIVPPAGYTGSWIDYDSGGEVIRQSNFVGGLTHGYQADLTNLVGAEYFICVEGKMLGPCLISSEGDRQYGIGLTNDGPDDLDHAVYFGRVQMLGELRHMTATASIKQLKALRKIYKTKPPWYLESIDVKRVLKAIELELSAPRPRPNWFNVRQMTIDTKHLEGSFLSMGSIDQLQVTPATHRVRFAIGEQEGRRRALFIAGSQGEERGIELVTTLFRQDDHVVAAYQWISLATLYRPGASVLLQWRSPSAAYEEIVVLRQHSPFEGKVPVEVQKELSRRFTHSDGNYRNFHYDLAKQLKSRGLGSGSVRLELSSVTGYRPPMTH